MSDTNGQKKEDTPSFDIGVEENDGINIVDGKIYKDKETHDVEDIDLESIERVIQECSKGEGVDKTTSADSDTRKKETTEEAIRRMKNYALFTENRLVNKVEVAPE